jgi:hypothetical protein
VRAPQPRQAIDPWGTLSDGEWHHVAGTVVDGRWENLWIDNKRIEGAPMLDARPVVRPQPTDMPGLFNVTAPNGQEYRDLTVNQVESLAAQNGWRLEAP